MKCQRCGYEDDADGLPDGWPLEPPLLPPEILCALIKHGADYSKEYDKPFRVGDVIQIRVPERYRK